VPRVVLLPDGMTAANITDSRYPDFFHQSIERLPSVLHVSWLNLERKIKHYRSFWYRYHASLYNLSEDRNTMFPKPWPEVSNDEITALAVKLEEAGPRFIHHPIDLTKRGAVIPYWGRVPENVREWHRRVSQTTRAVYPHSEAEIPSMAEALTVLRVKRQ